MVLLVISPQKLNPSIKYCILRRRSSSLAGHVDVSIHRSFGAQFFTRPYH